MSQKPSLRPTSSVRCGSRQRRPPQQRCGLHEHTSAPCIHPQFRLVVAIPRGLGWLCSWTHVRPPRGLCVRPFCLLLAPDRRAGSTLPRVCGPGTAQIVYCVCPRSETSVAGEQGRACSLRGQPAAGRQAPSKNVWRVLTSASARSSVWSPRGPARELPPGPGRWAPQLTTAHSP